MRRLSELSNKTPAREEAPRARPARQEDSVAVEDPTANESDSLVDQLEAMYSDREMLQKHFGVSDPNDIVQMVRNLEEQLREFYGLKEELAARANALRAQLDFVERYT